MSTVLGIIMVLMALAFGFFGYMIAMRGKYALITNYVMEKHAGKVDSRYAQRVGWIEIFAAVYFLIFGILTLCIQSNPFAWTVLIIGIVLLIAAALLNLFLGKKL